jgi:hypothetical protein
MDCSYRVKTEATQVVLMFNFLVIKGWDWDLIGAPGYVGGLRVRVRVVRAIRWASVRPDAGSIKPRLEVAPRPHAPPGMIGIALGTVVLPSRISRPIQRETVARKPFAEIDTTDGARRHRSPVLIQRDGGATHRPSGNESIEIVRRLGAAAILQAVLASAELTAFGRVDAPKKNARAMDFERATVNYTGLPD